MRLIFRAALALFIALALVFIGVCCWLFLYSGDLPKITSVAQYAPDRIAEVVVPCSPRASVAIPYSSIGQNLHSALSAAEIGENDPGVLATIIEQISGDEHLPTAPASEQIARIIFCVPSHALSQQTNELRFAIRLEHFYTRQQLFTIYVNMAYFGESLMGVQDAAQHFFHKNPNQLDPSEAALLAGLLKSPSYFSPVRHPDRALVRRNKVIDAMIASGTITASEGAIAKASPLGLAEGPNSAN
jgi:penicillin-binding protein 1A